MGISQADIDNWFTYHKPGGTQTERYTAIREKAKELAELFVKSSPSCADQTAAVRDLRKVVMAMNLTIACNENPVDDGGFGDEPTPPDEFKLGTGKHCRADPQSCREAFCSCQCDSCYEAVMGSPRAEAGG